MQLISLLPSESLVITIDGKEIRLTIGEETPDGFAIAIEAPDDIHVNREETLERRRSLFDANKQKKHPLDPSTQDT